MMDKPDRVYAALEEWAGAKASAFQADPTPEALDEWANAQDVLKIAVEILYPPETKALDAGSRFPGQRFP